MEDVKRIEGFISVGSNRLLWLLLGMSLFDALATDFGLRFELIEEANPVMDYVYEYSVLGFYFVKVVFPLVLFTFQPVVARSRIVQRLLQFTVGLYAVLSGFHVFWIWLHLR
ncbi:hypothetical protein DVB69_12020 [Sporosarcina sp. BI001-red]|uniref:DUF5658 family protein n=1 Tax=Sporosarcina sp. BI001-red TaxID=2282866 RepID=UPI000E262531|nr:DUF5658 family protein [Sporosarcina sp. BI001-red]REB06428.1 hypothetical protein DVB69_12020 [Sporosarcina sp. BI001-red]